MTRRGSFALDDDGSIPSGDMVTRIAFGDSVFALWCAPSLFTFAGFTFAGGSAGAESGAAAGGGNEIVGGGGSKAEGDTLPAGSASERAGDAFGADSSTTTVACAGGGGTTVRRHARVPTNAKKNPSSAMMNGVSARSAPGAGVEVVTENPLEICEG